MNYINWEYYVTAVEEMNFTKAAKRLYISQQSLSSHIAKIEEYYGAELFDRKNNLTLTAAGESLYKNARRILDIERQTELELKDIRDFESSYLRVGVSPYRGARILPILLPRMKAEHPNVKVELVEKRLRDLRQDLLDGRIDLMFGYRDHEREDITEESYAREEMLIVVPKSLFEDFFTEEERARLLLALRVSLKEFERCPFLSLSVGNWLYSQLKEYCGERNISLKVELSTANLSTMLNLCIAGMGAIVCPDLYLSPEFIGREELKRLHIFRFDSENLNQDRVIKYLNNRYVPKMTKEFVRLAKEMLA